jgi:hypothetical protein
MRMHLIKQRIQPEREATSWRTSVNVRQQISVLVEDSPSLRRHLEGALQKTCHRAVKDALLETELTAKAKEFSLKCPHRLADLLEGDLNALCAAC